MASHSGTDLVTAPLLMTILQYTLDPQLATNRPLHSRQIGGPFTIRHGLLKKSFSPIRRFKDFSPCLIVLIGSPSFVFLEHFGPVNGPAEGVETHR